MELFTNIVTIIAALTAIGTAIISVFSALNYDSFDRKLMPRNKSMVTYLKQITGIFLIIIPMFIFSAYIIAFTILEQPLLTAAAYLIFLVVLLTFLVNKFISLFEWLSEKIQRFHCLNNSNKLFTINRKVSNPLLFIATFIFLIILASLSLFSQDITSENTMTISKEFLISSVPNFLIMSLTIILILAPLYSTNNEKKYSFVTIKYSEADLVAHLENREILLDYFLSENISVLSDSEREFKIVRRYCNDSYSYEIYKLLDND